MQLENLKILKMQSNKYEKTPVSFMTLLLLEGFEPRSYKIHVHNESARNATTTIQAAIKKLSVVEQYTLSTIPIPLDSP
jgi:hypothetical protein